MYVYTFIFTHIHIDIYTHTYIYQYTNVCIYIFIYIYMCKSQQCTASHYNQLQMFVRHCNTLQHTASHCSTLQHTATHCNTLQHSYNSTQLRQIVPVCAHITYVFIQLHYMIFTQYRMYIYSNKKFPSFFFAVARCGAQRVPRLSAWSQSRTAGACYK